MRWLNPTEVGRGFAHIVFSIMFIYDIMGNNNDFGWDNAGIYAVGTFGGEAILALARLKYGASIPEKLLETDSDSGDSPKPVSTRQSLAKSIKSLRVGKAKPR